MNMMQTKKRMFLVIVVVLLMGLVLSACGKSAESPPSSTVSPVAAIAMYEGADRDRKLVEAAKKEGALTVYTSIPTADMKKITAAFEKKYGITVSVWRAGPDTVLNRAVTEARGGKFDFDIAAINAIEMESLHREKLLQEVKSPYTKDLIPEAIRPHKEWVATRINVFVQAYNTNKIKKEELPKTYQDLLDPKWKGHLGIVEEDIEYFAEIVQSMGQEKGLKFWKDLVATNGLSVRNGHTVLAQMVASGEVPLGLTVYSYKMDQLKNKNKAPVDWFTLDPVIALPGGVGVSRKAPHPNAAVLFYDFMISDAQPILAEINNVPTHQKYSDKIKGMKLKFVDPAAILDENDKWEKVYEEIIVKNSSTKG